jgi:hypothetical protein
MFKDSKVGCDVGYMCVAAVAYADDSFTGTCGEGYETVA